MRGAFFPLLPLLLGGCNAVLGITEGVPREDALAQEESGEVAVDALESGTEGSLPETWSEVADVFDVAADLGPCADAGALLDAEGCPCDAIGDSRECARGKTGPSSACKAGTQNCVLTAGSGRWGACKGATAPEPTDTCFDGVDNDCDGLVDGGCKCSEGFDLCKDPTSGVAYSASDLILLDPPKPKWKSPLAIYVLSKSPLANTSLQIDGGYCAGGAGAGSCAVGKGCSGWYAIRQTTVAGPGGFPTPGTYGIDIWVDDSGSDGPCNGSFSRKIHGTVTVDP